MARRSNGGFLGNASGQPATCWGTKLGNYKAAVEAGKRKLEEDHQRRCERLQGLGLEEDAAVGGNARAACLPHSVVREEERRLIAKSKIWTTADFEPLKFLGAGAFGSVHLVQLRGTHELYALKQMEKAAYRRKNDRQQAMTERDLLAQRQNHWFVKLFTTFQDSDHIYMVMEFLQGGDLYYHIKQSKRFTLYQTCFYMAELLGAVDAVHRCGFVHRDLKPENLVLDSAGHLKLLDFGLCSQIFQEAEGRRRRCKTLCGTALYMSPEVVRADYGSETDLWAVGAITFECLAGFTLFDEGKDNDALFHEVESDHARVLEEQLGAIKPYLSGSAEQVIRGLICPAHLRLSAAECQKEPFFAGLDFQRLHLMEAPIKIEAKSPLDFRGFKYTPRPDQELRMPSADDIIRKDRKLEWAHYEFDARSHGDF